MSDTRITVRLGEAELAKLDALAMDAGVSRSLALRRLLDAAVDVPGPPPSQLDRGALLGLLEERARAGSAPAIRELLRRQDADVELKRLRKLTTDS